jgi:hypothetical protein
MLPRVAERVGHEPRKAEPNAVIQIGSLILVKATTEKGSRLVARTLTQTELIGLEANRADTDAAAFAQAVTELALDERSTGEDARRLPPP